MSGPEGRPGFDDRVGLEERAVGDGRARIAMVAGEGHLNPAGAVHGGAIATLVDVAMGKAVASTISDAELPVTIEMKVNFLEPGRPGLLIAARRGPSPRPPLHRRPGRGHPGRGRRDRRRGHGDLHQHGLTGVADGAVRYGPPRERP